MKKNIIIFLIISYGFCGRAQISSIDAIQQLDEIILSDIKLNKYNSGFKITVLKDSVIHQNSKYLTHLLAFKSNIYFKEFGSGMLSSPSFRGTNAAHTAVVWNGININSQLNGQTDFNQEMMSNYSSLSIRSGGGSVQYGSGAIGGSIHLNNTLKFITHFENNFRIAYGSFDTKNINYSMSSGTSKWSTNIGFSYIDSKNDYKFLGTEKTNVNGEFNSVNLVANLGYLISKKNNIKLYHHSFLGSRNISGTLVSQSRSKYESENFRNLLEWAHLSENYISKLKIVYLQENFRFFENKDKFNYSFGKVRSLIAKHDFDYDLSKSISLRSVMDYTAIKGFGSRFDDPSRHAFSMTTILKHELSNKFCYGFNIRKDITSDFRSPVVFSIDARHDFSKYYSLQINGSRNFRVPTFNDLYWQPGGNLNLKPENAYQIDLGQIINYHSVSLLFNAYYIKTSQRIQWLPTDSGFWSPVNKDNTESYGTEFELKTVYDFENHKINFNLNYSYTESKDLETSKQLVYVPFHKGNASFKYQYKNILTYYQHQFVGGVFITDENIDHSLYSLKPYNIANLGFSYTPSSSQQSKYSINLVVNNLFNIYYENIAFRPMPNRNYQIQTTIKF